MTEKWIQIKGYPDYQISNKLIIRSLKGGKYKIVSPYKSKNGYYQVSFSVKGLVKKFYLHRIIADTFIEKVIRKPFINHKNGNKLDNSIENLEWCTQSENVIHALKIGLSNNHGEGNHFSKLTLSMVKDIRDLCKIKIQKDVAKLFKVSNGTISAIINNKTWN